VRHGQAPIARTMKRGAVVNRHLEFVFHGATAAMVVVASL
jgi:hypothetical protein